MRAAAACLLHCVARCACVKHRCSSHCQRHVSSAALLFFARNVIVEGSFGCKPTYPVALQGVHWPAVPAVNLAAWCCCCICACQADFLSSVVHYPQQSLTVRGAHVLKQCSAWNLQGLAVNTLWLVTDALQHSVLVALQSCYSVHVLPGDCPWGVLHAEPGSNGIRSCFKPLLMGA
jgi:hypothetical protein